MGRYFIATPDVTRNLKDQPEDEKALGYFTVRYGSELKIVWEIIDIKEAGEWNTQRNGKR